MGYWQFVGIQDIYAVQTGYGRLQYWCQIWVWQQRDTGRKGARLYAA